MKLFSSIVYNLVWQYCCSLILRGHISQKEKHAKRPHHYTSGFSLCSSLFIVLVSGYSQIRRNKSFFFHFEGNICCCLFLYIVTISTTLNTSQSPWFIPVKKHHLCFCQYFCYHIISQCPLTLTLSYCK